MSNYFNDLGQPIGFPTPNWQACQTPPTTPIPIQGNYCHLEALDAAKHAEDLFHAYRQDTDGTIWTYLPYGPFEDLETYKRLLETWSQSKDPLFHAIVDKETNKAIGIASYLRIEPEVGVIEVGHINYSPELQKTPAATEAMYLMMKRVFDELGYRRYEWKCDLLNAGSKSAAERLGFSYEGIFRQATMYKNRNRDTAWFSILDSEWSAMKKAFESWLEPSNFHPNGQQIKRLADFR